MKMTFEALRPDQLTEVSEKVETLLWEQGIIVDDTDICAFFAQKGATVSGSTIRLPKEMLRAAIKSVPKQYTFHARNPERTATVGIGHAPLVNSNSGMSFIQDADGTRRLARVEDQIKMLKLMHTSDVIGVSNAGVLYPTVDIDPADAKYLQMINALVYGDKPFISQGVDGTYAKAAIGLARIATGYSDRHVCMSIVNSLSPMAWDTKMLDVIRIFAEENQPVNISNSFMIGATAPLNLISALIMACAEALFGITYSQLVRPGAPVVFGCFPGAMDMRSMSMSYGSPEFAIMCAAAAQMAAFYEMPFRGGGALSSAQATNAQSGAESALNLIVALNCGVHYMHQSIGTLDSILTCSAEKFVMDEEIFARVARMQTGMGEMDADVFEVIQDGTDERGFLALESTALHFRDVIFQPTTSEFYRYEEWREKRLTAEAIAQRIVEERVASYVEPDIGADIKKQLRDFAVALGAKI